MYYMCLVSILNTGLPYKFSTRLLSMLGCTTSTLVASLTPGCPTTSRNLPTMDQFSMNGELKLHAQYLLVMHSHDPHMHVHVCMCACDTACTCTMHTIHMCLLTSSLVLCIALNVVWRTSGHTHTHSTCSYVTLIGVYEVHGRVHN